MPSTTAVLDEAAKLVKKRLAELDEERKRLERALAGFGGNVARRAVGRPPKAAAAPARPRRRRRKRRGGTRGDQAVKLVAESPGITASEIAKKLKIKPNYLYRVLSDLEKEKRVSKKDRKYFPAG